MVPKSVHYAHKRRNGQCCSGCSGKRFTYQPIEMDHTVGALTAILSLIPAVLSPLACLMVGSPVAPEQEASQPSNV